MHWRPWNSGRGCVVVGTVWEWTFREELAQEVTTELTHKRQEGAISPRSREEHLKQRKRATARLWGETEFVAWNKANSLEKNQVGGEWGDEPREEGGSQTVQDPPAIVRTLDFIQGWWEAIRWAWMGKWCNLIHILKRCYVETRLQGGTFNCWEDYYPSYWSNLILLVKWFLHQKPTENTKQGCFLFQIFLISYRISL